MPRGDLHRRPRRSSAADRPGPPRRPGEDQGHPGGNRRRRRTRQPAVGGRLPTGTADVGRGDELRDQPLDAGLSRARFLQGTEPGQFVAWAAAKDHEGIKALVDRLNAGPPPEETPEATVYSLKHISATAALNLLTAAVPKAKITPDTEDPRRLTAFASPADQEAIKKILEKIDVEGDAGGGATVAVYQLEGQTAASSLYYTLTVFRTAFPKAKFSLGTEPGQFVAWATAKDHAGIKALFARLNAAPPAEQTPKLTLYTLKSITAASAMTVLQTAVPRATFTADPADPQRLTAMARPADHETIKAVLAEIDVEGEGGGRSSVAVYRLQRQASATAMSYAISLLTPAFPKAQFLLGTEPGQFVAWASAKDHEEIKALFERLNAGPPPEEAPDGHPLPAETHLRHDRADRADHRGAQGETHSRHRGHPPLDRLCQPGRPGDDQGDPGEDRRRRRSAGGATVAVYQLEGQAAGTSLYYTLAFFRTAFPKAMFSVGTETGQFVAWASAKDHEGIKALFEQLNAGPPPEQKPQVALYALKFDHRHRRRRRAADRRAQSDLYRRSRNPQRLTANARPADHETIKTVLAKIDVGGDAGTDAVGRRLPAGTAGVGHGDELHVESADDQAFPHAKFSQGTEHGQFVAWATAKDQQEIKALFDRLNAGPPPEEAPVATVYPLKYILATTALNVLTAAVPQAKLTPDTEDTRRLTAYASPADQATIKAILEEIDVEGTPAGDETAAVYQLEGQATGTPVYYTLSVFRTAFPKATFSVAPNTASSSPGPRPKTTRESRPWSPRSTPDRRRSRNSR